MKHRLVIPTVLSVLVIGAPAIELAGCDERTDPPVDAAFADVGSLPSDPTLDAGADAPPDSEMDAAVPIDTPPDPPG